MKHLNEIKIGVFVISGLVLLIFGWAYLREFAIHAQNEFTVVFNDVAGLTKGSFVRINGLRVGRVDNLTLDTKKNTVLVGARIQIPDIEIPVDSRIFIRTSGYVGDKYLDITLGMSNELIMDGDVLIGEATFDPFKSLEAVEQVIDQIDPNELGKSIKDFTKNANKLVEGLPRGNELKALIEKAHDTVLKLNEAIDKTQALAIDENAQGNLNKLLNHASIVSGDLKEALKNANNLANNKIAFESVNDLLIRASKIITQLDQIRADPLIQNEIRETLQTTKDAAKKVAFTSDEVSMALNQKFILPKLLFGKLLPKKKNVEEN